MIVLSRARIPSKGPVKLRWEKWRKAARAEVMRRAEGRCEACARPTLSYPWMELEWGHLFGRRHIIGEPMCSHPLATIAFCPACHHEFDANSNPTQRDRLRWHSVHDLVEYFARHGVECDIRMAGDDPLGAIRLIDGQARAFLVNT